MRETVVLASVMPTQLVKLRFFSGLTLEEAAKVLGVAVSTASADWLYSKGWLQLEMRSDD